jgi:hypothetical protein
MNGFDYRAAILVMLVGINACAPQVRHISTVPPVPEKLAELWQDPEDIAGRDLFHGAGGKELTPAGNGSYEWISTDTSGYSGGFTVRGSDGRIWDVKLGPEAQTEVVASSGLSGITSLPSITSRPGNFRAGPAVSTRVPGSGSRHQKPR